ncbi:MAG TPA: carbohydrate-binding family 9-like protein [Abditibacteriaceae bacterium]|jgi:hypothetical protein
MTVFLESNKKTTSQSSYGVGIAALACCLCGRSSAQTQQPLPAVSLLPAPPELEVPYVAKPPRLGSDDEIWQQGALVNQMTLALGEASHGLTPAATQVRLLWSQSGLYIRFICEDESVYAPEEGRDAPLWKGDVVEVFLDVKGDARQWVELQVSPNGSMFDQLATLTSEPRSNENRVLVGEVLSRDWWTNLSWNLEGWQTHTLKKARSWQVDMMLPPKALHRLGLSEFAPMTLRLNLVRYKYLPATDANAPRRLMAMNWAPVSFGCPHISPQAMGFARLMPPPSAPLALSTQTAKVG